MEKNVKMTNKMALEFVLGLDEVRQNVEVFDKISKMLTQVERKNSTKGDKLTKNQQENLSIKVEIAQIMSQIGKPCQIKDICAVNGLSNQKVSALVRQMVNSGEVCRIEDKKVALFQLVSNGVVLELNEGETVALAVIE